MTGLQQAGIMLELIRRLEGMGLKVVALGSDNHRKNQAMFKELATNAKADPTGISFPNPSCAERQIWYLNDPVHLMKSLKCGWVNTDRMELKYPEFPSASVQPSKSAKYHLIARVYDTDKVVPVKLSVLTRASTWSQNIEKQNVNNALKVFHARTRAALRQYGSSDRFIRNKHFAG